MKIKFLFTLLCFLSLCACSSFVQDGAPQRHVDFAKIPNAKPKVVHESRFGNPAYYTVDGRTYHVLKSAKGFHERGIASWYGTKFNGQLTSTRVPYNLFAMTAAMRTIPIPTFVEVSNLKNNRHVIVEVNDRGPFVNNRIIDLSYAAAGKLGMLQKGTALVEVRAIDPRTWNKHTEHRVLEHKPKLQHKDHPKLYIQVGAYTDKISANHIKAQLAKMILQPNRIEDGHFHGRTIYKVQIGPLKSVGISDIVTQRLAKLGYAHTMAVIE